MNSTFIPPFRLGARSILASSIASFLLAGMAHGVSWPDPQTVPPVQPTLTLGVDVGGDYVDILGNTVVTLQGAGGTLLENIIVNATTTESTVLTLTVNNTAGAVRTLAANATVFAGANGQTLVISGSADFRPGFLGDGGFTNVQLVKNGGAGELILDGFSSDPLVVSNDLDGARLSVVSGTVSVVGGGSSIANPNPISSLSQPIGIDGTLAKLRFGTLDGSSTAFNNSLQVTDSGTLEHTATSTDSLTGFVNITNAKTLTANITAGSLTLSGGVMNSGGLIKTGGGTLTLAGVSGYTGATTVTGGTFAVTGSLGNTAIAVSAGATFAARPGSGIGYAGTSNTAGTSGLTLSGGAATAASFTMVDNAIGTFRLVTGGLVTQAGLVLPTLTFEIGGTAGPAGTPNSIDLLDLGTMGGNASIAAGTKVSFAGLSSATSLALGNYTFLTAASGLGSTVLTLASSTITVGSLTYNLSLASSTANQEVLTVSGGTLSNNSVLEVAPASLSLSFGRVLATAIGTKTLTVSRMSGTSNTGATAAVSGGAAGATIGTTASGNGFITGSQSWVINVGLTAGLGAHSDAVVITNTGNAGQGAATGGPGEGLAQLPINVAVSGNVLGLRSVTGTPLLLGRQLAATNLSSLTQMVDFHSTGSHADTTDVMVDGSLLFNGASNTLSKSISGQNAPVSASGTFYSAPVVSRETGLGDTYANVAVSYTATPLALRSVTATPVPLGRQLATTNLNSLTRTATFNSSGTHEDTTDVMIDGILTFDGMNNTQSIGITGQNAMIGESCTFYSAPVMSNESGLGDTYPDVAVSYTATPLALRSVSGTAGDLGRVIYTTNLNTLSRTVTFTSSGTHPTTTDVVVDGSIAFGGGGNGATKSITGQSAIIGASGTFYSAPVVTAESGLGDTYANVAVGYTATPLQDRVITADTVSFGLVHIGATVGGATTLRTVGNNASFTAISVGNASAGGFSMTGGTNPVFNDASVTDGRTLGGTLGTAGTFTNAPALILTPGTEAGVTGMQNPVAVAVKYDASVFSGSAVWSVVGGGSWGQFASANWTDTTTPAIQAAPGTFGMEFTATDTAIFNAGGNGTVTLDGISPSLAAITFNGGSHPIARGAGTGVLTLKNDSGPATITVSAGSQSITAPVILSSDLVAMVTADMLTLSGGIDGAGKTLTKEGAGVLTLSGIQSYAALDANAGTTLVNGSFTDGTVTVHANAMINFNASQTLAALVIGDGGAVTFGDGISFGVAPEKFTAAVPEPCAAGLLLIGAMGVVWRRPRRLAMA